MHKFRPLQYLACILVLTVLMTHNAPASERGTLAVIFEDSGCHDCNGFHSRLLENEEVLTDLRKFTTVRLDAESEQEITNPQANSAAVKDWVRENDMTYRPGVVSFDEGREIRRMESLLYDYHFKENLRYVGGGFHKSLDYQCYSRARTEALLSSGVDIILGQ